MRVSQYVVSVREALTQQKSIGDWLRHLSAPEQRRWRVSRECYLPLVLVERELSYAKDALKSMNFWVLRRAYIGGNEPRS